MTIDVLRKLYEAQPFQSFVLHLADGLRDSGRPSRICGHCTEWAHDSRLPAR